jgi:hypothetical protein
MHQEVAVAYSKLLSKIYLGGFGKMKKILVRIAGLSGQVWNWDSPEF